jgi:NADPH-dependent curcumin reductase CurA
MLQGENVFVSAAVNGVGSIVVQLTEEEGLQLRLLAWAGK